MRDIVAEALEAPIANIGQIDAASKRRLESEVRSGRLAKWRGFWYPVPGAPFGIGPLKTCYGSPTWRDRFAAMSSAVKA